MRGRTCPPLPHRCRRAIPLPVIMGDGVFNLGAVFKINRCYEGGKPSWAGVALGGTGRWPASASVALAEHDFPLT